MNSYKDDFVFLLGLVSGAVVGGIAASLLLPRGIDADEPIVVRGVTLTGGSDEAIARAQQIADATMAKVQREASEITENAVRATTESAATV